MEHTCDLVGSPLFNLNCPFEARSSREWSRTGPVMVSFATGLKMGQNPLKHLELQPCFYKQKRTYKKKVQERSLLKIKVKISNLNQPGFAAPEWGRAPCSPPLPAGPVRFHGNRVSPGVLCLPFFHSRGRSSPRGHRRHCCDNSI